MKKINSVIVALITFVLILANASASCSTDELAKINQEAANVKVSYEIKQEEIPNYNTEHPDEGESPETLTREYVQVSIVNLTDNVYIKIFNNDDGTTKIFSGADAKDGVVTYRIDSTLNVAKLDYMVYTSSQTSCKDQEIVGNSVTVPKKNDYYQTGPCITNPDIPECQKYVTADITSEQIEKVAKKVDDEIKEKNKEKEKKDNQNFIEKNKEMFIIGGSIIIVLGVGATAVVVKKRRSRLI